MIKAIVTDIEGTTSDIAFVHKVLFPYARERMAAFVQAEQNNQAVIEQLQAVRDLAGAELDVAGVIKTLIQWIDDDQKITPLKALQGMIWQSGYENGDFTGHVYNDAVANLKRWQQQGIALYVFSSGSVKAQKLLFGYSDAGDMTPLFSGYFDTKIGAKRERAAYDAILAAIGLQGGEVLFLSDVVAELDAAAEAGIHTVLLDRDHTRDAGVHTKVDGFDAINPAAL